MEFNGILTVSYIIATILFILALGGLSHQETARRGNWYGIIGMAIALIATIWGIVTQAYVELIIALLIGITAAIAVGKQDLEVDIRLSMLLTPLKGKIEQTVNDYLDENLA